MKSLQRRINDIRESISGFKDNKDRQNAIRYLKSIDPDIQANDIETIEDYMNELKSFFAPIPNTPEYEKWIGTEMHKKYLKRQKQQPLTSE